MRSDPCWTGRVLQHLQIFVFYQCVCVCVCSYLSLDHVLTMQSHVKHTTVKVDGSFGVQLLENPIQGDEGSCTAHTSTSARAHAHTHN